MEGHKMNALDTVISDIESNGVPETDDEAIGRVEQATGSSFTTLLDRLPAPMFQAENHWVTRTYGALSRTTPNHGPALDRCYSSSDMRDASDAFGRWLVESDLCVAAPMIRKPGNSIIERRNKSREVFMHIITSPQYRGNESQDAIPGIMIQGYDEPFYPDAWTYNLEDAIENSFRWHNALAAFADDAKYLSLEGIQGEHEIPYLVYAFGLMIYTLEFMPCLYQYSSDFFPRDVARYLEIKESKLEQPSSDALNLLELYRMSMASRTAVESRIESVQDRMRSIVSEFESIVARSAELCRSRISAQQEYAQLSSGALQAIVEDLRSTGTLLPSIRRMRSVKNVTQQGTKIIVELNEYVMKCGHRDNTFVVLPKAKFVIDTSSEIVGSGSTGIKLRKQEVARGGPIHPHARRGQICWGNASVPIAEAWSRRDWETVIRLAIGWYTQYNRNDPYHSTEDFATIEATRQGWQV